MRLRFAGSSHGNGRGKQTAALLEHGQAAVFITLILLTIGAWALTVLQAQSMTGGPPVANRSPVQANAMKTSDAMDAMAETGASGMADMAENGWSLYGLAAFVLAWAVMMVAMMLPAVAPMLLLYRTIVGKNQASGAAFVSTWVLVAGYLLVWSAVGAGVYALMRLGGDVASRISMAEREQFAALAMGVILVIAGLYQFAPLKDACLRQCQSPFGFIMGHWRNGRLGAFRMGIVHGAYCLGCCWALFAVLVAAGVMNLVWMLVLTLAVFAEKVLPFGRSASVVIGGALLVLGVFVASGTLAMPWLG